LNGSRSHDLSFAVRPANHRAEALIVHGNRTSHIMMLKKLSNIEITHTYYWEDLKAFMLKDV